MDPAVLQAPAPDDALRHACPAFSLVIPTYNRPRALHTCLSAISAMDYPRSRLEVIVVDDGGKTDLSPIVEGFRPVLDITLARQPNAGPAAARNVGAATARHDYLAFTDDDCAPRRDWLWKLAAPLLRDATVLVGGRSVNALPRCPYATASQTIIDVVNAHFNRDPQDAMFFPSDNMALSRRRFLEIGGFGPRFRCSEDRDLCDRWSAHGWRLVFAPDAIVDHARVMGLAGFWRQHIGYGRGAWHFHRARAMRGTGQLQVEGSFYAKCFAEPFRTHPLRQAIPLAVLLGVWQLANTAGFFCEALAPRLGRRGKPASPDGRPAQMQADALSKLHALHQNHDPRNTDPVARGAQP